MSPKVARSGTGRINRSVANNISSVSVSVSVSVSKNPYYLVIRSSTVSIMVPIAIPISIPIFDTDTDNCSLSGMI